MLTNKYKREIHKINSYINQRKRKTSKISSDETDEKSQR